MYLDKAKLAPLIIQCIGQHACLTFFANCYLPNIPVWNSSPAIHIVVIVSFLITAAPGSGTNGDFGDWNAFPGGQMPAAAQNVYVSGNDLFGGMTVGPTPAPAPGPFSAPGSGPSSADLFDLMGPTQTLTSSQSLNFSMSSTQSMSTTVLPQSKSQVCMIALMHTHYFLNNLLICILLQNSCVGHGMKTHGDEYPADYTFIICST